MNIEDPNSFLFSHKYRVWRHVMFWIAQVILFSFTIIGKQGLLMQLFTTALWIPLRMLYIYPLIFWLLPYYLLKEKYTQFSFIIVLWIVAGWILNYLYRFFFFIPVQEHFGLDNIVKDPWSPGSFFMTTTTAGCACIVVLFKHWAKKQQEWLQAEKEKVTAELQLLKAQVHPHFLFNTLNNIYSFSLENSLKTPGLIVKLSSLLSYMLYDCKAEQVLLQKEIEVMKDYIDLEKERYANRLEISVNIEGDIKDKYIAPLLLLPFLENAFKHGTSEQLERPWLSMDIAVKQNTLRCKIVNSKNEFVPVSENGIGIQNVKKRLAFLYPDKHELKLADEGDFFVVSLLLQLTEYKVSYAAATAIPSPVTQIVAP
jgi:hypothetical protein